MPFPETDADWPGWKKTVLFKRIFQERGWETRQSLDSTTVAVVDGSRLLDRGLMIGQSADFEEAAPADGEK